MPRPKTDWNKDIPWLGAWIPMCVVFVAVGAFLRSAGVPMVVLGLLGPVVMAAVYLWLWGSNGRLVDRPVAHDGVDPDEPESHRT